MHVVDHRLLGLRARDRGAAVALDPASKLAALGGVGAEDPALGGGERLPATVAGLADAGSAHLVGVDRKRPSRVGGARLDRRAHREIDHRVGVEAARERVPHATRDVLELLATLLDLRDPSRELARERVELRR